LAGKEANRHRLDQGHVGGVTEAVQEQDGRGQGIDVVAADAFLAGVAGGGGHRSG
jgi:hypothetical protein